MIQFYNTLGRKKEEFIPITKDHVGLYTCGPTIYNYPHIGNYRAYVFGDLLKRFLRYQGYTVKHIMNLTDVDDKTIRDSQKQGLPLRTFTDIYAKAFFEDLEQMNIQKADSYPRATEHIQEMVALIQKLMKKGYAYKGEDGSIYYKIHAFKNYGKLSGVVLEDLEDEASGRVKNDEYDKENARDFALWKAWDETDGDVFWETELGKGRPGWHIECSAMSSKYLGETFDIHTGGVDLIFPHHENEIAQSVAATEQEFVKYWLHNEWLLVEGKKMSKSLGNFYTLRDVIGKGYSPMAIRYLLISIHYRQQLNFTFEGLKAAESSIFRIKEFIKRLEEPRNSDSSDMNKILQSAEEEFNTALDDDLNTSAALAAVFILMKEVNILISEDRLSKTNAEEVLDVLKKFDSVLGLELFKKEIIEIPAEITELANQRLSYKKQKDFKKADELRAVIQEKGYSISDTADGFSLKKI